MSPTPLLLAALLGTAPTAPPGAVCIDPPRPVAAARARPGPTDEGLERIYRSGDSFADFLETATRRRADWVRNYEEGVVDEALVARARALPGRWYILAIAVDGCSDSVSTIPYLALLEDRVPGLEMRIVPPAAARALQEARRTSDGRAATPTLVLLDAEFEDAGCFIERPRDLQEWWAENDGKLDPDALFAGKMEWYSRDGGRSTVEEIVERLESASRGRPRCDASG